MSAPQTAERMLRNDDVLGPVGHTESPLSTFFNHYFPTANEQYYTPGPGRFDTRSELVLADSEQVFKDLGVVIRELARDNALWVNQTLMPIEVTDKIEFQVTILHFDDVVTLEQTPAFGTSRTLDFFKDKKMVRNKRWGKALTFELDMMLRKEGQELFTMQLSRIIRAFKDHASYIALNALFAYSTSDRNYFRTNAALANLVNMQHYQREIDEFGCFNKSLSRGFGVMYRYANAIENVNGVRPQFAIIPVEKQGLFKFGINKINEFYRGGQNAVTQFMNGEEIATLQGISLRPSPCFPQHVFDNNEPVNLLSNVVTTGEYIVYEDLGRKFGLEYSTGKHGYIDCFSQSARGWKRIWVTEMNRHNGRWDSEGRLHPDHWQLIEGNVYEGQTFEDLSDQYIYYDQPSGSFKVCHYIGDMEKQYLPDDYLKSIVLTAHGRYPRLKELKDTINDMKNFPDLTSPLFELTGTANGKKEKVNKVMNELIPFVKYLSQRLGGTKNPVFDTSRFGTLYEDIPKSYQEALIFFDNCFSVNHTKTQDEFIKRLNTTNVILPGTANTEEKAIKHQRAVQYLWDTFNEQVGVISDQLKKDPSKANDLKKIMLIADSISEMITRQPVDVMTKKTWFNIPMIVMYEVGFVNKVKTMDEQVKFFTDIHKKGFYSAFFERSNLSTIAEKFVTGKTDMLSYKNEKGEVKMTDTSLRGLFPEMDDNQYIYDAVYNADPTIGVANPPDLGHVRAVGGERTSGFATELFTTTLKDYITGVGEMKNPFKGLNATVQGKPYRTDTFLTSGSNKHRRSYEVKRGRYGNNAESTFIYGNSTMAYNADRVLDKYQCPIERAVALAVLSTPIHRDVFETMYDYDVIVPSWYILARPWQVDQMSGMCLAIGGKQTGTTYISEVHVTMSWKSVNQSGDLHATQWIGAVLKDPNRRAVIRTAFNDRYLQGANHDLWTDEELYHHATVNKFYSENPKIPSFIVLSIGVNSKWNEDVMSLKGKITQHDELHYSSCGYYNVHHQFGLIHTESISVVDSYGKREAVNVIMFQGSQRQVGNVNGDVGETVENRGHHGHQQPDRCDVRFNGMRTMTDE